MYKGTAFVNKIVKKREQERVMDNHKEKLMNIRPVTSGFYDFQSIRVLNNRKKQMLVEDKFTEIERQNRLLLEKIQTTMNKKHLSKDKQRMNKSLNTNFRRKQLQNIQVQNAKLLKRLQDKKSDYEADKLKQQWKKQKEVIRNLANYPFIIRDKPYKRGRAESMSRHGGPENYLNSDIELMRIRNIDGFTMIVTVTMNKDLMIIKGDNKKSKEIRIIEIARDEAIQFIEEECDGKIELIFDRLRYDPDEQVLYLLGQNADLDPHSAQYQESLKKVVGNPENMVGNPENIPLENQDHLLKEQLQF